MRSWTVPMRFTTAPYEGRRPARRGFRGSSSLPTVKTGGVSLPAAIRWQAAKARFMTEYTPASCLASTIVDPSPIWQDAVRPRVVTGDNGAAKVLGVELRGL